ncbi:hypothetical protein AB205_0040140 [Aquarana catesbeiana]|uniref:Uncharacterized protein n=1 Tax=Aquarana catesbeiana TaxID=8400 RepID=A0A2G9R135_AQUCT|nr:hypothetical protein AB205_0040140 [Aquarana catesbeiana]
MCWGESEFLQNATILTFVGQKLFYEILEKNNFEDTHGVSRCAICHQGISMYAFGGCNPFLVTLVVERKWLHPQNTSIDPP